MISTSYFKEKIRYDLLNKFAHLRHNYEATTITIPPSLCKQLAFIQFMNLGNYIITAKVLRKRASRIKIRFCLHTYIMVDIVSEQKARIFEIPLLLKKVKYMSRCCPLIPTFSIHPTFVACLLSQNGTGTIDIGTYVPSSAQQWGGVVFFRSRSVGINCALVHSQGLSLLPSSISLQ